jgi:hypothetical protein
VRCPAKAGRKGISNMSRSAPSHVDFCKILLKETRKFCDARPSEKIDKRYKPYLAPNNKYYDEHCGYCAEVKYLQEIYRDKFEQEVERNV